MSTASMLSIVLSTGESPGDGASRVGDGMGLNGSGKVFLTSSRRFRKLLIRVPKFLYAFIHKQEDQHFSVSTLVDRKCLHAAKKKPHWSSEENQQDFYSTLDKYDICNMNYGKQIDSGEFDGHTIRCMRLWSWFHCNVLQKLITETSPIRTAHTSSNRDKPSSQITHPLYDNTFNRVWMQFCTISRIMFDSLRHSTMPWQNWDNTVRFFTENWFWATICASTATTRGHRYNGAFSIVHTRCEHGKIHEIMSIIATNPVITSQ